MPRILREHITLNTTRCHTIDRNAPHAEIRINQRCGNSNNGTIESGHEDFAVRVEGLCYVEVIGSEGLEPLLVLLVLWPLILAGD